ncbi:Transposable element Tc1 transposase, partial [Paramuricea clavata]
KDPGYEVGISLERRGTVLVLSREGYTQRQIAGKVGCSQRSVSDILKKKQLTGSVKDIKILGKKRKTTRYNILVRKSKVDRFKTASEIKAEMQNEHAVHMSVSTTRRRPRDAGRNGRKPRKNHV